MIVEKTKKGMKEGTRLVILIIMFLFVIAVWIAKSFK
jgi:hypothetical protein